MVFDFELEELERELHSNPYVTPEEVDAYDVGFSDGYEQAMLEERENDHS